MLLPGGVLSGDITSSEDADDDDDDYDVEDQEDEDEDGQGQQEGGAGQQQRRPPQQQQQQQRRQAPRPPPAGRRPRAFPPPLTHYADPSTLPRPEPSPAAVWRALRDDARVAGGVSPAPRGPLVATVDGLGRVAVADAASGAAVRLWKGYRDAGAAWALPARSHPLCALGPLLVLHAPRRAAVELWWPRAGRRVAAWPLARGAACRLLAAPSAVPCGAWGLGGAAAAARRWRRLRPCTVYVVDLGTGRAWDVLGRAAAAAGPAAASVGGGGEGGGGRGGGGDGDLAAAAAGAGR